MSEENEHKTAETTETVEEAETKETKGTETSLDKLNDAYVKRFWKLKGNISAIPEETYKFMCETLHKQYVRDYSLLDGAEGIETDKDIEQLQIRRDSEIERLKLEQDKQIEQLKIQRDEKLEHIKLEHKKLMAQIKRESDAVEREEAIAKKIADAQSELKALEVVPADLPKKWWQRYARPNRAKVLALREVDIEVAQHFATCESELARKEGVAEPIVELMKALTPCPRGRRARQRWERDIMTAAVELERRIQRRAKALAQLEETIRQADEQPGADAFEEPESGIEPQDEEADAVQLEPEEEPQNDAEEESAASDEAPETVKKVDWHIEYAEKQPRAGEVIKLTTKQLKGQLSIEELGESKEPEPGNEQPPEQ